MCKENHPTGNSFSLYIYIKLFLSSTFSINKYYPHTQTTHIVIVVLCRRDAINSKKKCKIIIVMHISQP